MNMRKRRLWLVVAAVLSVIILGLVLVLTNNSSPEDRRYHAWAETLKVHDWEVAAPSVFAEANCESLTLGHPLSFRIQSEDHLKATTAVLYAYCPDAVSPYLKSVDKQYGDEYSDTTEFIRKAGD